MPKMNEIVFVVSERGAGWPATIDGRRPDFLTVHQDGDEQLASLVARVASTLDWVKRRGVEFTQAYLVCSRHTDEAALVARTMMASSILRAMCGMHGGRLVLAGDASLNQALRPHLLGLAETLTHEAWDPRIEVMSSFGPLLGMPKDPRRPPNPPRGRHSPPRERRTATHGSNLH
jgi:hypothetical protein